MLAVERIVCLIIGYLYGCFLTGELVARCRTGESAALLGTGNPGMANLGHELGRRWGLLVLLGDILKTALACLTVWLLFGAALGRLALLWAERGGRHLRGPDPVRSPVGDGSLCDRTGHHPY